MSPTSSSTPVLQLHHVSHFYKKGTPVLADASFAVPMALPLSHRTRLLALVTPEVFLIALVPVLASFRLLEWLFSQSPPGAPLRESSA